jgi:hypothetical protein
MKALTSNSETPASPCDVASSPRQRDSQGSTTPLVRRRHRRPRPRLRLASRLVDGRTRGPTTGPLRRAREVVATLAATAISGASLSSHASARVQHPGDQRDHDRRKQQVNHRVGELPEKNEAAQHCHGYRGIQPHDGGLRACRRRRRRRRLGMGWEWSLARPAALGDVEGVACASVLASDESSFRGPED